MLAAALDRMQGAFAPLAPPRRDDDAAVLDLQGRPAIAWGGAVLDCFELMTGGPAGATRTSSWPHMREGPGPQRGQGYGLCEVRCPAQTECRTDGAVAATLWHNQTIYGRRVRHGHYIRLGRARSLPHGQ